MSTKAVKENPLQTADIFLDPNLFSKDTKVKNFEWNKSGTYVLYTVSKKGSDWQQGYVRNA